MIDKILAISGKPGLFRLVARGNNMLICESLADGHRFPALQRDKVLSLADIAMYSTDEEVPLNTVFRQAKELTGGKIAPVTTKDAAEAQKEWFRQVFPTFDDDRVRASDIKKFIQWYNILIETGNDDFSEPEAENAEDNPVDKSKAGEPKAEKKPVAATPKAPAVKSSSKATSVAKTAARRTGGTQRGS